VVIFTYILFVANHNERCGGDFDNKCFIFKLSNSRVKELAVS
jgi:hypothetical protein